MTTETGRCHCGAIEIEVDFPSDAKPHLCNCSICAMKGAVMFDVLKSALRVVRGEAALGLYTFNTGVAQHRFCTVCGIHVFHQLRSEPDKYGVNGACFEGRGRFDHVELPIHDGANSHPRDTGKGTRIAGVMRVDVAK